MKGLKAWKEILEIFCANLFLKDKWPQRFTRCTYIHKLCTGIFGTHVKAIHNGVRSFLRWHSYFNKTLKNKQKNVCQFWWDLSLWNRQIHFIMIHFSQFLFFERKIKTQCYSRKIFTPLLPMHSQLLRQAYSELHI